MGSDSGNNNNKNSTFRAATVLLSIFKLVVNIDAGPYLWQLTTGTLYPWLIQRRF